MSAENRTVEEYTLLLARDKHITVDEAKSYAIVQQFENYVREIENGRNNCSKHDS